MDPKTLEPKIIDLDPIGPMTRDPINPTTIDPKTTEPKTMDLYPTYPTTTHQTTTDPSAMD